MKLFTAIVLLLAGWLFPVHAQQGADDKYFGIYGLLQQADTLADAGDSGESLAAYNDVQAQLQQFQKNFPGWNPNIISFRLNHVAEKIAELKSHQTSEAIPKKIERVTVPTPTPANPDPAPTPNLQLPTELDNLRTQLQVAQAANEIWQAKLKEALAIQPTAADPRELARAQEKIRWLMKENDLLRATHGGVPTMPASQLQLVTNIVTVFVTNNPMVEITPSAPAGTPTAEPVIVTNYLRVLVPDTNALEMAHLEYAAAVKNYNDEHERAEQLATKLQQLQKLSASATNVTAPSEAVLAELRAENVRIKSELAALRAAPPVMTDAEKSLTELKQTKALLAALQSEAQIAALEKMALERKLQQVLAATNSTDVNVADYESRIRELTQDRNSLIEKLDLVGRQNSNGKKSAEQMAALNDEVRVLRSRLALAETPPVPYTAEEQALLKTVAPVTANLDAAKKPISEMPAGTADLVASAQSHFARQEFDAAQADYLKILEREQNNGLALANLATIELQAGKFAEAEKHITAALAQNPDDAYNLSTLGCLKFRQQKYDDALAALSRAAQFDPSNPEIQYNLGVTLGQQGQRKAAETALRRAIQLSANYAPAHNDLAVIYLSQTPPLAELARWHYQKAIAAGLTRNPGLEKLLAEKGVPVSQ